MLSEIIKNNRKIIEKLKNIIGYCKNYYFNYFNLF